MFHFTDLLCANSKILFKNAFQCKVLRLLEEKCLVWYTAAHLSEYVTNTYHPFALTIYNICKYF